MTQTPRGLASGGKKLWTQVLETHDLDEMQVAMLEQACRQRDRTDTLARLNYEAGDEPDQSNLRQERDAALAMSRLLAALRLPDEAGRKPQARQIRGVQSPTKLSAAERMRLRTGS
jgi:hypothetical protein